MPIMRCRRGRTSSSSAAGTPGSGAAYYLLKAPTPRSVVVLRRAERIGFGASGRNGGWVSALWPVSPDTIARRHGRGAALAMLAALRESVEEVGRAAESRPWGAGSARAAPWPAAGRHAPAPRSPTPGWGTGTAWLGPAEARERLRRHRRARGDLQPALRAGPPAAPRGGSRSGGHPAGCPSRSRAPGSRPSSPAGLPRPTADRSPPPTSCGRPRRGRPPCRGTAGRSRRSTPSSWRNPGRRPVVSHRPRDCDVQRPPATSSSTASAPSTAARLRWPRRAVPLRLAGAARLRPRARRLRRPPRHPDRPPAPLKDVAFTTAWADRSGSRAIDPSVGHDPSTGCGWAGGYHRRRGRGEQPGGAHPRRPGDRPPLPTSPHCPGSGTAAGGGSPNPLAGSA